MLKFYNLLAQTMETPHFIRYNCWQLKEWLFVGLFKREMKKSTHEEIITAMSANAAANTSMHHTKVVNNMI